nr:hypothetical protein [Tanacetum cinerariifolium]
MADVNVNALTDQAPTMAPPTRTDDKILPHIRWVPIGKSNCYLDAEKSQSNPIYKIATVGCYKCQLDEQWFDLTKDTLRYALQITPVNNNKAFSSHPSFDALINFVNDLGYPKVVRNLSNIVTNDMFQPWRALTTIINLCLTGKTSGFERPRAQVLRILWGVHQADHLLLIEEVQVPPKTRFSTSLANEEPVLGYLKFSAKGTKREVFGMPIPGSDPDSLAPKPAKATKKSKPSVPKADPRPPITKPTSSQQPEPKPVPAKSKGIPEKEPRFDDEEADVHRPLEESLKGIYDAPQGQLPLVVIREPESGKYQSLLEDEDVPGIDAGVPDEGQAGPNPSDQDEGQTGPNPDKQDEGQAGPNPGDAIASQPLPSPVVHAGPNLEHIDLEVIDFSTQPHPEQIDKGFTATTYPKAKDLSFGDLFFNDKPSEANSENTTAEIKAELMVSITIHQDTSSIPPMTTPVIDLTSRPESLNVHRPLQATATETKTTTTKIHPPPPQPQQSTTDFMLMKCISKLKHIMANLIQDNKHLEERLDSHRAYLPEADVKEILHQRMWETNSYNTHEDHMMIYEALEKFMNRDHSEELLKDLAEAWKKKKKRRDSPKMPLGSPPHQPPPPLPPTGPSGTSGSLGSSGSTQVPPPPPPPPSTNQQGQSHGSAPPSSSKTTASAEYKAWTTTDTRLRPSVSSTPEDLQMDDDMNPNAQVHSSDDEDIENAHIPKVNLRQDWWKPLKEDRPATPKPTWSIRSSDLPVLKNNWASTLVSTYSPPPEDSLLPQTGDMAMLWTGYYQIGEYHKLLTDSVDDSIIRHNVSKPLPLGGPPGQVTIQSDFFFNKDLEYLRNGSKGSRPALSISKMKAAYYPDVGLEQMVPDHMWIDEECKYDIAPMYGISHWWFQRKRFYIDSHTSEGDRRAVRTHMRILSVVRIEVFSMYGYDYMKKIVLRRADLNEHIIAERDLKYLYPSDFEDLYLLNLQDPSHFEIDMGFQMIMRFNEIHKFSDDTLQQIDKALDYRVKEFKVNRMNPGLNIRFWIRKDVDRSKEFMFAIQKWLKTRRIFRNLESFVGGRVRDGDYRLLKRIE